jgi:hypothetical protein
MDPSAAQFALFEITEGIYPVKIYGKKAGSQSHADCHKNTSIFQRISGMQSVLYAESTRLKPVATHLAL